MTANTTPSRPPSVSFQRPVARSSPTPGSPTSGSPVPRGPRQDRRTNLTDRKLNDLAAKKLVKPLDITDSTQKGLVARVRPNGVRAFYYKWREKAVLGTKRRWRSVRLDAADVAEARRKASEAAAQVAIGRDPSVTAAAYIPASAITLAVAAKKFTAHLTAIGRTPRYVENVEAMFENHVLGTLGRHRLIDLSQRDFAQLLTDLTTKVSAKAGGEARVSVGAGSEEAAAPVRRRGRPVDRTKRAVTVMPNRVHSQIRSLLRWATEEGHLPPGAAPTLRRPIDVEPSRARLKDGTKRILRIGHYAHIWLATEQEPLHVRVLVRLLLLLPFRRQELTELTWREVRGMAGDDGVVSFDTTAFSGPRLDIPAERMKAGRPQMMPLPPVAQALLAEMQLHRGADGDFVFSASAGRAPYGGWQTLLHRLRTRCTGLPEGWTIHDLRTAFSTEAGDVLDAEPGVTARLLAHSLENLLGVTWRYDQSRRVGAMLDLLTRWEGALLEAVEAERRRRSAQALGMSGEMVRLPLRAAD